MIVDARTTNGRPMSVSGVAVANGDGSGVMIGDCSGVAVGVIIGGAGDGGTQAASKIAQMMSHLIDVYPS